MASSFDTAQSGTLGPGAVLELVLHATPIVEVAKAVRIGSEDTLAIASGQLIVKTVAGAEAITVTLGSAVADAAWGVPIRGIPLSITITPNSNGTETRLTGGPSVEIGVSTLAAKLKLPRSGPDPTKLLLQVRAPDGKLLDSWFDVTTTTQPDPNTGLSARYATANLPLPLTFAGSTVSMRAAATDPIPCPEGASLDPIPNPDDPPGGEPLILVHGIQLQRPRCDQYADFDPAKKEFANLIAALRWEPEVRKRFRLYTFKYPAYLGVNYASDLLRAKIEALGAAPISFIAHSMGGLVLRRYLGAYGPNGVRRVITLGTPHTGTPFADVSRERLFLWDPSTSLCYQQQFLRRSIYAWPILYFGLIGGQEIWSGFQDEETQGMKDLRTDVPLATSRPTTETSAILTTLAGSKVVNGIDSEDIGITSFLTLSACYLESKGILENDGLVPVQSARPEWSLDKGPEVFQRDHWELQGNGARDDLYLQTIIARLLAGEATIVASPEELNLSAVAGGALPASGTVSITNGGGGTLTGLSIGTILYGQGEPAGWLGNAAVNGVTAPTTLTLQPNTTSLAAGTYHAIVPISAAGNVSNSPLNLNVTYAVSQPAGGTPPDYACSAEGVLRSLEGQTLLQMTFINATAEALLLYWLDYQGARVLYGTIQPGSTWPQGTYLTQPWIVIGASGTCYGIWLPTLGNRAITVSALAAPPSVDLMAMPSTITAGQSSTLKWVSTNASACSAVWTSSTAPSGTQVVSPAGRTTYAMTCSGANGSASASAVVTVTPSEQIRLVGAAQVSAGVIRLTPASEWQAGAAWFPKRVLGDGFEVSFSFRITSPAGLLDPTGSGGGDGFAFVVQGEGDGALGDLGEAQGYAGITKSIAVEFDTWKNPYDPNNNHISIQTRGATGNSADHLYSFASAPAPVNLSDGAAHRVRIRYLPGSFNVYVDEVLAVSAAVSLTSLLGASILDPTGAAWFGFTAATGLAFEIHEIFDWSLPRP